MKYVVCNLVHMTDTSSIWWIKRALWFWIWTTAFFFKTNPEARAEMNIKLYFLIRAHLNQSNERALKAFENG